MTSKTTVLAVVCGLIVLAGMLIAGAFVLLASNDPVPEVVWTLAGTTIGALASLLVSTRATIGPKDQPVAEPAPVPTAPALPPATP